MNNNNMNEKMDRNSSFKIKFIKTIKKYCEKNLIFLLKSNSIQSIND
jgi:hypothetical protein